MTGNPPKSYEIGTLVGVSAIGFFLFFYGVISAVLWSKATWYSFFTIGSLLFLAPISFLLRRNNLKHTLLEFTLKSPLLFVFLYLIFFALGSLIDLFYGTKLCNLWHYPRYDAEARAIHNLIIGYPFAFLSLIPLYEISEFFWLAKYKRPERRRLKFPRSLSHHLLLGLSVLLILLPVLYKYLGFDIHLSELCVVGSVGGIILVDSLRAVIRRESFLTDIAHGNYRLLLAILSAAWLAGLIHEVPNTFSGTWLYQNVPITSVKLFGVNVVVLFLGWLFLLFIPVSLFRFIEFHSNRKLAARDLWFNY